MPLSPYSNYFAFIIPGLTLFFMALNPTTQIPLAIGFAFLVLMTIIYFQYYRDLV
ncbi:MAG: Hypothetical protein AJITA_00760 [Acetilactobacillus jinshanensis]